MNENKPKKYLSATQIGMFLRCPQQYAYRYIDGIKSPPSGAMKQSSAWHKTLENNYSQKIKSAEDLPLMDMTDIFAENYDIAMGEEEVVFDEGDSIGKLKDQGVLITEAHHKAIAPTVQPVEVEKKFLISLGDDFPYDLMGILDLIDNHHTIIDNKAYGKTPNQGDIDKDLQLGIYALGYRVEKQKTESGLRIDAIIKNKVPKAVQIRTHRTKQDCQWLLQLIERVAQAMQSGVFYSNPTGYLCSQRFCGYWDKCKK